jgi:hypothetical protein
MGGRGGRASCAALITALGVLNFAGTASAKLTGNFTVFQQCPRNTGAEKCIYSEINSGAYAIGGKSLAIVNPVILQAGFNEDEEGAPLPLYPAANGETLSKTPQPIPGGLLSFMPPAVKRLMQGLASSPLNRVWTTLELTGPAKLSYHHLAEGVGVAIEMPSKLHLENPLLGKNCYIGSSASPIQFGLTVGTTNPPPPNLPITGSSGTINFLEGARIIRAAGSELVDNAWSVPKASGCGGVLVDSVINKQMGLPSPAGRNTVILQGTASITTVFALNQNDKENP